MRRAVGVGGCRGRRTRSGGIECLAFLFFLFLSFAALTTVIAVFECLIAGLMDLVGMGRARASLIVGASVALLAMPCVAWDGVLDWEDFAVSKLWLPIGAIAQGLFVVDGRFGWGWAGFRDAVSAGRGWPMPDWMRLHLRFVVPVLVFVVLVAGLATVFA